MADQADEKGEALALMVLAVHKPYSGPNGYIGCQGKSCWPSANRTSPWPCTLAKAAEDLLGLRTVILPGSTLGHES